MPTKDSKPKKGRPAAVIPEQILDAARELFAERGFEGTSTRQIALAAKCNSAMIAYHFGNKDGLYLALFKRFTESVQESFIEVLSAAELKRAWPELLRAEEREFCHALFGAARKIVLNECMHKIFSREMMRADGGQIVKLYAKNGGVVVPLLALIRKFQASGKLKSNFDVRFAALSLLAPIVYSKIGKPMLKHMYKFESVDETYVRELCVYLTQTFFEGRGC